MGDVRRREAVALGVEHVERMAEFIEAANLHAPIVSNVSARVGVLLYPRLEHIMNI